MTQVMNHNLGYKIAHNPGYEFDLGYKNKSDFFFNPGSKSVTSMSVGYAIEEQFLLYTTYIGNKFRTWLIKKLDLFL